MRMTETETAIACCPRFEPAAWNEKELTWREKLFVTEVVPCVFHVPLNMGRTVRRLRARDRRRQQQQERQQYRANDHPAADLCMSHARSRVRRGASRGGRRRIT